VLVPCQKRLCTFPIREHGNSHGTAYCNKCLTIDCYAAIANCVSVTMSISSQLYIGICLTIHSHLTYCLFFMTDKEPVKIESPGQAQTALKGLINGTNTTPFIIDLLEDEMNVRTGQKFTPDGKALTQKDLESPAMRNVLKTLVSQADPKLGTTNLLKQALKEIDEEEKIPPRERFHRDLKDSKAHEQVYKLALKKITESFAAPVIIKTPEQAQIALDGMIKRSNNIPFVITLNKGQPNEELRQFTPDGNAIKEADLKSPAIRNVLNILTDQADPKLKSTKATKRALEMIKDEGANEDVLKKAVKEIQDGFGITIGAIDKTQRQDAGLASNNNTEVPQNTMAIVAILKEKGLTFNNPSGTDSAVASASARPDQVGKKGTTISHQRT
jgi:hypothetical protein